MNAAAPLVVSALGLVVLSPPLPPQDAAWSPPPTVAESSSYARTSTSADVEWLVDECVSHGTSLVRLSLGRSAEGKDVPLVLAAEPAVRTLAEARASGKPAVLVMANIHAGEVEGKEAVQILLREIALGEHRDLLKGLVLAFVPDYNPDGNDKIDRKNRPDQAGPVEGVGQRANGMGLDLNRDYVKVEAPETRGLLQAVRELDAALVMDLHTTDGSFHGYDLTYAGPLHPASDPQLLAFTRDVLLPELAERMRAAGFETFDYGDFADQQRPQAGWVSFEAKPRYGNSYFGLCNRITVLSEAYSHAPFEQRIASTRAFVLETLAAVVRHSNEIELLRRDADTRARGLENQRLPTAAEMALSRPIWPVRVGAVREEKDPVTGLVRVWSTGESRVVEMPVYAQFDGLRARFVPKAWIVPAPGASLVHLLELHGLLFERAAAARRATVRAFRVRATKSAPQPFQKHTLVSFEGGDEPQSVEVPAGALVVPSAQPLARLAFLLFEPESDDGLATWGILGDEGDAELGRRFAAIRLVRWEDAK